MKVYTVITAAGLSSRMHAWKPLLPIGGVPSILRLLRTFSEVSQCILVTGFRHTELEAVCSEIPDVEFVYNPDFAQTQMFESACLGFSVIPPDCGRVLFTPADIPMVAASTVKQLAACPEPIVFPVFQGRRGHPVSLDAAFVPEILRYRGAEGLKGALASLPVSPAILEVDDPFVRMDMDTPEDYHKILRLMPEGASSDGDETQYVEHPQLAAKSEHST